MAKVDPTMQKKIIDKISEMEASMTSAEFKSSLNNFFELFSEKMKDDKSVIHIETFVSSVLSCINSIRLETKLCASMFLYSFLNFLPEKARLNFNRLADELEKEIAPKTYDLFLKLQSSYLTDKDFRESLGKKQLKHNTLMLILLALLMILEICVTKFGTDKNNKERRFEKFYNELEVEDEIKEQLSNYTNLTFDVFENRINYFEKIDNENPEEFKQKVKIMLKTIMETREEMRFYLNIEIDSDTAKRFDEKTDEYKNQMYDLQEFVGNKKRLLDDHVKSQIAKEEQFSKFLLQDLAGLYSAEELTINQATKIISRKYEEIFSNEKDDKVDVSHESIKVPDIQKQPFMRTDSELEDFISPHRFKARPQGPADQSNRAFFPSGQPDTKPPAESKNVFENFSDFNKTPFETKEIGMSDFKDVPGSLIERSAKFNDVLASGKVPNPSFQPITRSLTQLEADSKPKASNLFGRSDTIKKSDLKQNNFDDDLPASHDYSKDKLDEKDPFMAATRNLNKFPQRSSPNKFPNIVSEPKKSPFGAFELGGSSSFANDFPKPSIKNFDDFDNFNDFSKFKIEDQGFQRNQNLITSESQLENQLGQNPAKPEPNKNRPPAKNMDFNSVFLESSNVTANKDGLGFRQSHASIGNKFGTSKFMNISAIDKKSMSSFMEKKPNAKINFGATRFTPAVKADTTNVSEHRALISDAINKISTTINSKKISQVTIKPNNQNNTFSNSKLNASEKSPEQPKNFMDIISNPNVDRKPPTPFMPAYGPSGKPGVSNQRKNPFSPNPNASGSVQINFRENPNASHSNVKQQANIANEMKSKTSIPNFNPGNIKVQDSQENNFVFEMDDFNSVHSDKLNTPPEQSIHNYSNMIPANLKIPMKTPSHLNFSGNLGQADDQGIGRRLNNGPNSQIISARPKSSDQRPFDSSNLRVANTHIKNNKEAPVEGAEDQSFNQGPTFDNISNIKNRRVQSLEMSIKNKQSSLKPDGRPMTASNMLAADKVEADAGNVSRSKAEFSDNFSQFALDEKVVQAKLELEKNIEGHKQQLRNLTNRLSDNPQRVPSRDDMADQIIQQYNALFQKTLKDYEALIENNKYEMKEQKSYIDELLAQNEKYKYKTFNLENELISLKENNMRLNLSFTSIKKKYEASLAKQKEQIKQSMEAKIMALERSYQEKIQKTKNEAEIHTIKLTEELNNYIIENNNLKLELEFSKGDKTHDIHALQEKLNEIRNSSSLIQKEVANNIKSLREYIKNDLVSTDFKRISTLKRARDELLDTLKIEQRKNEELSKQIIMLSNECSVLKSNITFTPQALMKANGEKPDIIHLKVKVTKLKQGIKEASWIIHCMVNNLKHHVNNIRQLKMQELTKKMTNYENVTASQFNELAKLNFQCQNLKDELVHLKEKYEYALEQNKTLQKQILETKVSPPQSQGAISSDPEFIKKYKQLEYENKSLNDINRQISSELIQSKEQIILLRTESANTEQLYITLKNLEIENEDLMETNKCLFNELYEAKLNLKGSKPMIKTKSAVKDLEQPKYANKQVNVRNAMPINANSVMIVNNMPTINQTQYSQTVSNPRYNSVTGTAFIKKFDMFMEILNSQDKTVDNHGSVMDWISQRPRSELKGIAQLCVQNVYCLIKIPSMKLNVEEHISFKNSTIRISIKLNFINLVNTKLNLLNLKLACGSKFFTVDNSAPINIELQGFENQIEVYNIALEENYLLQMEPVFISFCLLDQVLYNSYVSGNKNRNMIEENFHFIALPLTINKLLQTQREELPKFSIIKNLQNVGEVDIFDCAKLRSSDLVVIFPDLTEMSPSERIFGLKINSLFGGFFLTILIDQNDCVNLKIFAMYQAPLHITYLQTLKFIIENL